MVEQMGVEPTTYTLRTYRSSQLSYCPIQHGKINIQRIRGKSIEESGEDGIRGETLAHPKMKKPRRD